MRALSIVVIGCFLLAGCSRDLELPTAPQKGKVHGTLDTQGHIPQAGNSVALVASDGSRATQETDGAGAFAFSEIAPGTYYLDAELPGFAPLVIPNIAVTSGAIFDAGVLKPAWLAGTPQQAVVTGKVVVPGGGDTQGGQVVFILQPVNQIVALAPIGIGGVFVQSAPPGTYDLKASHPLYVSATLAGVTAGAGQAIDLSANPISLGLDPATLTGVINKEQDGRAPVPASGVLVTLGDGSSGASHAGGDFSVPGLAPGPQTAHLTLVGYHDAVDTHAFTLTRGQTTALPPITLLVDRGSISGTVALADHQTALDVTVAVTGTSYNAIVTPDATNPWQGTFQIKGLPIGTYEVSATKAKYSRVVKSSVTVTANTESNLGTFTLAVLQGDFVITGDLGIDRYTRVPAVTLDLSRFTSATEYRASEDSTFTGVGFAPYSGSRYPFTLGTAQGTHTVYAQYKDLSGTISPTFTSQIVLDGIAPTGPSLALNGGAGFTNVANPLFLTLQAAEVLPPGVDTVSGLSQVLLNETGATLDGGDAFDGGAVLAATSSVTFQRDMSFTRSASGDGPQAIYAQFVDHAGNVSAAVRSTIVIDTVRPTGGLAIAQGPQATAPGYTNTPLVTLTETAAAETNGDALLIRLANTQAALPTAGLQPVSATAAWFLEPSTQGSKTVYGLLEDQAGNVSVELHDSIVYDTTPPSPVSAALVGPSMTNQPTVSLSLAAADDHLLSPTTAVTIAEDPLFQGANTVGPRSFPLTSQLPFALSAGDGAKLLFVRYRDAAGNDTVTTVPVTLKVQPPSGGLSVLGALADGTPSSTMTATANVTVALTWNNGATGYLLGNETLTVCPAAGYTPLTTSSVGYGLTGAASPRVVALCLIDGAGNTAGPYTQTIAFKNTAPTGCALRLAGTRVGGAAAPAGLTASLQVVGTLTGCSETPKDLYLTTGAANCLATATLPWGPYTAAAPVTLGAGDGLKTVTGCVRDVFGNTTSVTPGTITVDQSPPSPASAVLVGSSPTNLTTVTLTLSATDASGLSATQGVTASEDAFFGAAGTVGPQAMPGTGQLAFPLSSGDGPKQIYVRFQDVLGNAAVATVPVTLKTSTTVSGTVSLGAGSIAGLTVGADLSGVAVTLVAGAQTFTALSGAGGQFSFAGVPFGAAAYPVTAARQGYLSASTTVLVAPPGPPTPLGLTLLAAPSTVTGQVSVPAPAADSGGVSVQLTGTAFNQSAFSSSTTTAAAGTYSLPNVPGGTYTLTFARSAYAPVTTSVVVPAPAGGSPSIVVPAVTLSRATGSLAGQVSVNANGTGLTVTGADAAGAAISVTGAGLASSFGASADATGNWQISGIPVSLTGAAYTITVSKPGYLTALSTATVVSGATVVVAGTNLNVAPTAANGTVTVPLPAINSGNVSVALSGNPFNGSSLSPSPVLSAAGGAYSFGALPAGSYTLTFTRAGYQALTALLVVPIPPGSGAAGPLTIPAVTLARSTGAITGSVAFGTGGTLGALTAGDLAGATISVTQPAGSDLHRHRPLGHHHRQLRGLQPAGHSGQPLRRRLYRHRREGELQRRRERLGDVDRRADRHRQRAVADGERRLAAGDRRAARLLHLRRVHTGDLRRGDGERVGDGLRRPGCLSVGGGDQRRGGGELPHAPAGQLCGDRHVGRARRRGAGRALAGGRAGHAHHAQAVRHGGADHPRPQRRAGEPDLQRHGDHLHRAGEHRRHGAAGQLRSHGRAGPGQLPVARLQPGLRGHPGLDGHPAPRGAAGVRRGQQHLRAGCRRRRQRERTRALDRAPGDAAAQPGAEHPCRQSAALGAPELEPAGAQRGLELPHADGLPRLLRAGLQHEPGRLHGHLRGAGQLAHRRGGSDAAGPRRPAQRLAVLCRHHSV